MYNFILNRSLDNLMAWSFIKGSTGYLPKKYRDIRQAFDKVYVGTNSVAPRTRTCADAIQTRMPYAVGRLYVKDNFDSKAKDIVSDEIKTG